MCNRTAISSLFPVLTALLCGMLLSLAVAASDDLDEICAPFTKQSDTTTVAGKDIPYAGGLLWRIEKNGTEPSHILGTMHSQDRMVTNLSSQQRLLIAKSERLLIEVVPDNEANQDYLQAIYQNDGQNLSDALPEPMYQQLERIGEAYGLAPERLDQLEPWAAFSQIGRPKPVNGPTQDMVIHDTARRMGKPVIGLETMPKLIETLASLAYDDQITILKDTICNHTRIVRQSKTLLDMYVKGDLAGMAAFNKQPHYDEAIFDRFMQAVLYQRNERIFERLQPYLKQGNNFIALGALHLPESQGLLALIEQAGYNVTPLKQRH